MRLMSLSLRQDGLLRKENIKLNLLLPKISELNLERDEAERIQSVLQKANGLFIVAGPAYNKTAETLYALMNTLSGEHGERIAKIRAAARVEQLELTDRCTSST